MEQSGPVARLQASLSSAVDGLVALDADTLTVAEAGALLEAIERERNRLDGARSKLMASFSRRDGHRRTGHKSLGHWMADRLRRSPRQARKEARTAEQLSGLSATADALTGGDISLEHAAAIAEQASKSDDPQGAQRSLLAEAATGDPGRVRKAGRRLRREQDRRAEEARKVRRAHQQRTLSLRADEAAKTMWIEGRLPLIDGLKVRAAVDALGAPNGGDDPRSYGQRMADGLVQLVDRAGDGVGLPSQGGLPVEITAIVPVEAIEDRAGVPAGTVSGAPGGWADLSHAELQQLICDAGLSWLIVDPAGLPLAYGKTRRFASPYQRRVLAARDGGCRMPTCDAPPQRCLVHHEPDIDHPHGATDIDTMMLVCPPDHERRHKGGWTFELDDQATITVTSPDGTTIMTETAQQARARHAVHQPTHQTAPASDPRHYDGHPDGTSGSGEQTQLNIARETNGTYHTGLDPGCHPPTPRNGTVNTRVRWHPRCRRRRPRSAHAKERRRGNERTGAPEVPATLTEWSRGGGRSEGEAEPAARVPPPDT